MKKIFISISMLMVMQISFACSCSDLFSSNVDIDALLKKSDLVVVGYPIKNIDEKFTSENPMYIGAMILFKVDSVLNGKLKSDTIFVNQETIGNCSIDFIAGKKYILFGNQIKHYQKIDSTDFYSHARYNSKNKHLKFHNSTDKISIFKNLTKKYYTITTSQCSSFTSQDTSIWEHFNLLE